MNDRHIHECVTGCGNFYTCRCQDCSSDWTCPACEDDELSDDMTRQEAELKRLTTDTHKGH